MVFSWYRFELLEIFMAETSSNENEKPVAPASKKPSKKDEYKDV